MTKHRLAYILWDLNRLHNQTPALNKARHELFAAIYKWRALKTDPDGPWDTIRRQEAFIK